MLTTQGFHKFLDGPSTDKDPEEKKKDTAITSQNSPEAREERYCSWEFIYVESLDFT